MTQVESPAHLLDLEIASLGEGAPPRVGIAGVGGVASYAHVPAYRRLGFPVVLLYDNQAESIATCRKAMGDYNLSAVAVLDEQALFEHLPGLDFLDIALPSPQHAPFIGTLLDVLGPDCPPLLVQKPLAEPAAAERLITQAAAAGVRIGINLTGRWVPSFRKLRDLLLAGVPGDHQVMTVLNRGWNPKDDKGWRSHIERLIAFEMAVHHIDLMLWMLGRPRWVFAALQHVPGQGVVGDNAAFMTFIYEDGRKVVLTEDWTCRDGSANHYHPTAEEFVVSGSQATVVATPQEVRITSSTGEQQRYASVHSWFPDAFAGPAAEFACAIRESRSSPLDAASHLPVLRVIEAVYESAATRSVVELPDEPGI